MSSNLWEKKRLRLKPALVWSIAINSLRLRIGRTVLTLLTVAASCSFVIFLLTTPAQDALEREKWGLMLVLSLVVAMAGVLNTMLMSVTQRYREIGTIKCLGALDSFVLLSVLLEAALVGLAGATGGILAGLLFSLIMGLWEHGLAFWSGGGWAGLWWKSAVTLFVGFFLTTFGASIPAWVAARMPPVEAMRGEK
jgi:ABC-type lipoprotein release transport system permease subunit